MRTDVKQQETDSYFETLTGGRPFPRLAPPTDRPTGSEWVSESTESLLTPDQLSPVTRPPRYRRYEPRARSAATTGQLSSVRVIGQKTNTHTQRKLGATGARRLAWIHNRKYPPGRVLEVTAEVATG